MEPKIFFIGRWSYMIPDTKPNSDGCIVLIKKRSFGPLETYDWGIDVNGLPYEEYKWVENDFYTDENYFKHITKKELTEQIVRLISDLTENGLPEWASTYQEILDWLNSNL